MDTTKSINSKEVVLGLALDWTYVLFDLRGIASNSASKQFSVQFLNTEAIHIKTHILVTPTNKKSWQRLAFILHWQSWT